MAPTSAAAGEGRYGPPLGHSAVRCSQRDSGQTRSFAGRGSARSLPPLLGPAGGGAAGRAGQATQLCLAREPVPRGGSVGGGAWVSVSCKRRRDREIEEFPGTEPGVLRFARRRGQGRQGVRRRGPLILWKFQRELGKTGPGKAPRTCVCPQAPPRAVSPQKGAWGVGEGPV